MNRGSRKRTKAGRSESGEGRFEQIHSVVESEVESSQALESSCSEAGYTASRCSVRLIHEVVSNLDSYKREIVKSLGYEGVLHFPCIKQLNRRFALWLMTSVNSETSSLNIGDHISVRFSKYDVAHVFGIPAAGKRILDDGSCIRRAKHRVLDKLTSQRFKEHRSIKTLHETIVRAYMYPMTKEEEDHFRVAFTIFVVSILLAPSAKHDYASVDYWNAIEDPESIQTYDWAEYVVVKLLEAVDKLKGDVANNVKFPVLSGCSIFLQVFYLDSLELEGQMMCHNSFPRIRDFSQERMRAMITVDTNFSRHIRDDDEIPFTKLRDPVGCVYSWATKHKPSRLDSAHACQQAIWECAVSMAYLLGVPMESAGPLFVAASDFQDQINSGLFVNGTQAIKFMTVLVSIMLPYSRGFRYKQASGCAVGVNELGAVLASGLNITSEPCRLKAGAICNSDCQHCPSLSFNSAQPPCPGSSFRRDGARSSAPDVLRCSIIGDHVERSFNGAICSLEDMPQQLNVDERVARAMSQFYSTIRMDTPARCFDLNALSNGQRNNDEILDVCSSSYLAGVPTPWEVGYSWCHGGLSAAEAKAMLDSMRFFQWSVVVHGVPKHIEVSGRDLSAQLRGDCEIELDLFNALLRGLVQEDNGLYYKFGDIRWRGFFESDFMAGVLAGSVDIKGECGTQGGIGAYMLQGTLKCKMVFFPTLLQCSWVCFAWSVDEDVISVFEPSFAGAVPDNRLDCIERTCFKLKVAIQSYFGTPLTGRKLCSKYIETRLLTFPDARVDRMNRSGVLCYMFCCCFDGVDIRLPENAVDYDVVAGKLLHVITSLKDNHGRFPDSFYGPLC